MTPKIPPPTRWYTRRTVKSAKTLTLPVALVVTTILGPGACRDDSSTSDASTSDTNTSDTSDTGSSAAYCADIESMVVCESEPGCGWDETFCTNTCHLITDMAECEAIDRCVWETEGTEGALCHEPFT